MKKILLYGAFDRYNYGDCMMPIVIEMFIKKYRPDLLKEFSIEYASISKSDLSKYDCYKSVNINFIIDKIPNDSAIIITGGHILSATNDLLYLHMHQNKRFKHFLLRKLRNRLPSFYRKFVKNIYSAPWEYPYIVDPDKIPKKVKLIYNTIGGTINNNNEYNLKIIKKRLINSDYISVRDPRTFDEIKQIKDIILSPDSVCLISDLLETDFLNSKISKDLVSVLQSNYIVFQASPHKLSSKKDIDELVNQIKKVSESTKEKIILLPIGYASGHDDVFLLKTIHSKLMNETILLDNLNVWEILNIIKNSKAFFGTSLHGVITAMTFNVPHFGISKKVTKMDDYLRLWSVPPYNKCYETKDISKLLAMISRESIFKLNEKSNTNLKIAKNNTLSLLNIISTNNET